LTTVYIYSPNNKYSLENGDYFLGVLGGRTFWRY